ncbi:hypothetical protein [Vibrio spartinae]|uniref:Uncharacterized protein n=1 Tax=Vibrio spartinae TaxID=1918945 RepID=A0A1N6M5A2_9VIBR|nr:hypothetical protein [Vibrio spartinae]QMV14994.1 hypothetical protein Vspart_02272 [Vibrio spartinae]SIO94604.1 hypothetical protein VSP9026_02329 [Vibrio spartinae]
MKTVINQQQIIWDTFGNLETFNPEWLEQQDHWEDFIAAFFKSNGLAYDSDMSRVESCIRSEDKAAFASMFERLLPRLRQRTDLSDVDTVILAHWTPDLHLGTSVVNYVIHTLELGEQSFGLAISDRGLSAPFMALDCIHRYIQERDSSALLLIADQKHLLYRSSLMDELAPENSACIVKISRSGSGWTYAGYRKHTHVTERDIDQSVQEMITHFGLAPETRIIASPTLLARLSCESELSSRPLPEHDDLPRASHKKHIAIDDKLLCAAPFAALEQYGQPDQDYLLIRHDDGILTGVGFTHQEEDLCA